MKKQKTIAVNVGKAVRAYRLLTTVKTNDKEGFKLSNLETKDIFKVIRATNALKQVATSFEDFQKDAQERLKPEDWEATIEKAQKFEELSTEERVAVNRAINTYNSKVAECVSTEVEKDKEVEVYEHLSEEAFGLLVKANEHLLDLSDIILLQDILQ